jgi:HEPN domain-containing protein
MIVYDMLMYLAKGGRKEYLHNKGKENMKTTNLQNLLDEVHNRINEKNSFVELAKYNFEMKTQIEKSYYEINGSKPNLETIIDIAKKLPKNIHRLAKVWGWSNTEVKDKTYNWIKENVNSIVS